MDTTEARTGPAGAGDATVPGGAEKVFGAVRRLGVQRDADRWFTGVCAGTARRLDVDPVVVRALFVALTVAGGLGLALYGIAWAFLPDASGRIEAERALAGDVSGALVLAGALVVVDLFTGQGLFAWESWGASPGWSALVTVLAVAGVGWLVRERLPQRGTTRVAAQPPAAPAPAAPVAPPAMAALSVPPAMAPLAAAASPPACPVVLVSLLPPPHALIAAPSSRVVPKREMERM